jgi:hypothetical protein
MGGSNKTTQNTTQHTEPWKAAQPALNSIVSGAGKFANNPGLTGNESGALDHLVGLAQGGNPYAPAIGNYATTMLAGGGPDRSGMINDAYKRYQDQLGGTANGDYLDPAKNPWFSTVTQTIGNDVTNRLAGLYAGSGRDPAGAGNFGYNLGKGVAEATAPVFSDAYNRERQNQINAQGALNGAGNQAAGLLSQFDQTRLGNMGAGVNAASAAIGAEADPYNRILAAEAQRRGIPLSMLQQLAGIATPMGQAFGTTTGNSTTQTQVPLFNQIAGGAVGGLGLLGNLGGFGPSGWLYGGSSALIPKIGS